MITCRFEDNVDTRLRHLTADTVVIHDGKVLLVRRAPHLVEGGKFALPGGYMDLDETLSEAAGREFREETGWECTDLKLVNIDSRSERAGNERQNVVGVFLGELGARVGEPDAESSELRWVDVHAAAEMPLAFDHVEQLRLVLAHLENDVPIPFLDGRISG